MTRRSFTAVAPALALGQAARGAVPARVRGRASNTVAASPLSIGFETLDRKIFDPERCYPLIGKLGVKWARCQTGWARTETRRGEYDFTWLDKVVDSLLKTGIQPWFNMGYGNRLYTPGAPHETAVGWIPLNSAEARDGWACYVAKLAERFSSRVKHWEIWNEPNISNYWQPTKPNPPEYVEFVRLTAPILRRAVPGCVIIGGSLAGMPLDYTEGCFAAGMGGFIDKLSFHPYRPVPEADYDADLAGLRGIVNRYKPGMGLWQGENGCPSTNNSQGALRQFEWDEVRQAKYLLRRLLTDLSLGVELTSYFHTIDLVDFVGFGGPENKTNTKGLLRGLEYTPKPSYYALRNLAAFVDSEMKRADLLLRVGGEENVRAAAFARGKTPLYFWWAPASLQKGYATRQVRAGVWRGPDAPLESPVLVDLLTSDIVPVEPKEAGSYITYFEAPLRDYPMLLTDASIC